MTNFMQVIAACEAATGAGTKKTIMAALSTADEIAQRLIKEAQDPYRVFGVRKYELPATYTDHSETADPDEDYEIFFTLLDDLACRALTGNAARDAVTRVLGLFSEEEARYLTRVFDKDLKAGFSANTVNKLFPGLVPTFEVMLADKCETPEDFETAITFPCQADFKYDGGRTIAVVKKHEVNYYNRSGKEESTINGLFDAELFRIRDLLGYDYVLDGERYASNFTETMNAKKEGNDAAKAALKFRAFFLMPLSDWIAQSTKITMRHARFHLDTILEMIEAEKIVLSEGREVLDYADMMAYCNEAIDVHAVEGLILKNWESTYTWDRTMAWCKVKRMYDVDGKITGFYAGRKNSRLEHTLGGICVEGEDERGAKFAVNVGSGFSDEQRSQIWDNQKDYIGTTVTIKFQEYSKNKATNIMSLRFPVFCHFRDDK